MKKYKWLLVLLNLVALLIYFNYSTVKKEALLEDGKLVLLELAPVDPRSLMQGDYMDLRYKISESYKVGKMPKRGYCVVTIDSKGVAEKQRFQQGKTPVNANEQLIEYTSNGWSASIGAESYFFQEGHAKRYEKAKYGGVKIDKKGNSLLVGLYDNEFRKIK